MNSNFELAAGLYVFEKAIGLIALAIFIIIGGIMLIFHHFNEKKRHARIEASLKLIDEKFNTKSSDNHN